MMGLSHLEYFFVLMPFFCPRIFNLSESLVMLYTAWQTAAILYVLIHFLHLLFRKGFRYFSGIVYFTILLKGWEFVPMVLNGHFYLQGGIDLLAIVAPVIYVDYTLKKKNNRLLEFICIMSGALIFLNNISFVFLNNSSYTDAAGNIIYFWQTRNHLSSLLFIAMITTAITARFRKRRFFFSKREVFVYANIILAEILYFSGTAFTGLLSFLVALYVFSRFPCLYKPKLVGCGLLTLNALVVLLRIQDWFAWFIEGVLDKNLSLTGRTDLWDMAFLRIAQKPLIGYGVSNTLEVTYSKTTLAAHNMLLETTMQSGLIALVLMVILFIGVMHAISREKRGRYDLYIFAAMVGFLVMIIAEGPSPYHPWFIIMCIAYNLNRINPVFCKRKKLPIRLRRRKA